MKIVIEEIKRRDEEWDKSTHYCPACGWKGCVASRGGLTTEECICLKCHITFALSVNGYASSEQGLQRISKLKNAFGVCNQGSAKSEGN